jgi:hypothetical protein
MIADWQPIETAPDDADCLMLWNGETVTLGWRELGIFGNAPGPWIDDCMNLVEPTHWNYLPEGPNP